MAGYVMMWKDLLTDLRFRRVVRAYIASRERHVGDAPALRYETAVTHVLGALAQLWIHADTHIRDDNTIEASVDEIDELVGITGFCKLLPTDWLQVIDPDCIQLTDFIQHNGTVAKKKANHAKRQARYRERQKSNGNDDTVSPDVEPGDATASPSHPIPSHPIPTQEESATQPRAADGGEGGARAERSPTDASSEGRARTEKRGSRIPEPFMLTASMREWAKSETPDVDLTAATAEFVDYWRGVPGQKGCKLDWDGTWRNRMREQQARIAAGRPTPAKRQRPEKRNAPPDAFEVARNGR